MTKKLLLKKIKPFTIVSTIKTVWTSTAVNCTLVTEKYGQHEADIVLYLLLSRHACASLCFPNVVTQVGVVFRLQPHPGHVSVVTELKLKGFSVKRRNKEKRFHSALICSLSSWRTISFTLSQHQQRSTVNCRHAPQKKEQPRVAIQPGCCPAFLSSC